MNHTKIENILLDDRFYKWYLQSDEQEVRNWNDWRMESAGNQLLLDEAVRVLHSLVALQDEEGFPKRIHAIHSRLLRAMENGNCFTKEFQLSNKAMIPDIEQLKFSLS